ncbi:MAG: alpha/beta fold hydrolase [Acidimicrobiia bacterium]|nr:alpha/beta fold hydrolase [Acidimicrobiia bacterium]
MNTVLEVSFSSGTETIAGDLVLPSGDGPFPALLTVAGTGPQNRYGDHVSPDGTVESHPRHRWVGDRLTGAGIAQLRYDKRGVGQSTGGGSGPGEPPGDRDEYANVLTDVEDVVSALEFLAARAEIDSNRITVMGTSAGVYFSCMAAAKTTIPSSYILWGGVHMGLDEFGDLIYNRALDYANRGPRERAVAEENAAEFLARADRWPEMLAAARAGADRFEYEEDGVTRSESLLRLKQELEFEYPRQFKNINTPVMVIHGDEDMNVPVSEAYEAAEELKRSGNQNVTLTIVPGADHCMHIAPSDFTFDDRMLHLFTTQRDYPYSDYFINSVIGWIKDLSLR